MMLLRNLKLFSAASQLYRAIGLLVPLGSMLEGCSQALRQALAQNLEA